MFAAILRTPVHFFDTNPIGKDQSLYVYLPYMMYTTGRIINRFSKDIGFLDDLLPYESYQYTTVSVLCTF